MKRNILIVDDEPMVTEFLGEFLSKEGYNVASSQDSHEALEMLKGERFDLIMIDKDMTRINGVPLYSKIRSIAKEDVPLIILSASGLDPSLTSAMDKGLNDYILKPSDITLIRQRVAKCMGRVSPS